MKQVAEESRAAIDGTGRTSPVRWRLAALSLSMLLSALGTSIANVALPNLERTFDSSFQAVQWVVLSYLLAVTSLIVGVGRLGDIVGRRRLLLAGVGLFTVGSLLCGAAPTLWLLVAARAVQGAGAAIMMALAMASVGDAVPKARTGSAMGLLGTMSAIGTAAGPSLGGVLIATFGWRAVFVVLVPLGMMTFAASHRFLPEAGKRSVGDRAGFDKAGMLLLGLSLSSYALAMTIGSGFGVLNMALLSGAAISAALFVRVQTKTAAPLIRLEMFRAPILSAGLAMSLLVMTVMMATMIVGPFYLSSALGLDAVRVGLVMAVGPVVAALAGVPAGRLVDRFGAGRTTGIGLIGAAAGSGMLAVVPVEYGIPGYVGPLIAITAGYALFQAANNTAVMTSVDQDQRGVVSGLLNLSRNLGLITGASVMGAIFAMEYGREKLGMEPAAATTAGMRTTFAVATALIVVALVVAATSRMRRAFRPILGSKSNQS